MGKSTAGNKLSALGLIGGQSIFFILFCIILVAVADESDISQDWSLSAHYSLNPATERLCAEMSVDVHIYALWPQNPQGASRNLLHAHKNIQRKLDIIAHSSPHITYTFLDPEKDKPRLKALAEQYGELHAPAVFVTAPARTTDTESDSNANSSKKIIRIPYTPAIVETLENNIGSALLAMQAQHHAKVYLLAGHGELRAGGGQHDGIDYLTRMLRTNGYQLITLDPAKLSALQRIPKDGVLFIAGARSPLGSACITAVREFMQAGGNAFILADHRCPYDLSALLRQRGVLVGAGFPHNGFSAEAFQADAPVNTPTILCSAEQSLVGNEGRLDRLQINPNNSYVDASATRTFLVPPTHPCTSRTHYSGRFIISPYSSLCVPLDPENMKINGAAFGNIMDALGTAPYRCHNLISVYGNNVWPAIEQDSKQLSNPNATHPPVVYTLAAAFEYALPQDTVVKDSRSRMVIWSSRQAASNHLLKQGTLANELFILDALAWLDFRENTSSIPPSTFKSFTVECSDDTLHWVMVLLVIVIPMLSLGGAMMTWWDRR